MAGQAWVEAQETLDRMFQPLEDLLVGAVPVGSAHRVLDVGCGTGSTTLAIARRLGAGGHCTGIDISDPMIAMARTRAAREGALARFIRADAQTHAFEPFGFDTIISRLGVMFFEDSVAAFANLRRAAVDGAELRFVAWRGAAENPFMTTAERAAAHLLPNLPARPSNGPGQFAFADPDNIHHVLEHGGWADIDIRPIDSACAFPERELVRYLTRLGPIGRVLPDVDAQTRARVVETVRAAFEPYVHGAAVRFDAACWMVSARAPVSSSA
ncbi:class I SAM-dependent methyltransferase [Montanilutibacter psychrotolerans]|uniref:class I SAM-dependent methyltransferase n=1 Tax=Montanilutibacter psychrotolerans TaxID=1327343 RepID=UPI002958C7B4|nr:class I SAM-dependent methyltransferase [Lysobacter psychrotolerans]